MTTVTKGQIFQLYFLRFVIYQSLKRSFVNLLTRILFDVAVTWLRKLRPAYICVFATGVYTFSGFCQFSFRGIATKSFFYLSDHVQLKSHYISQTLWICPEWKVMFSLCLSIHGGGGTLLTGLWSQVLSGWNPSLWSQVPSGRGRRIPQSLLSGRGRGVGYPNQDEHMGTPPPTTCCGHVGRFFCFN